MTVGPTNRPLGAVGFVEQQKGDHDKDKNKR
jgi:hypothetical protein